MGLIEDALNLLKDYRFRVSVSVILIKTFVSIVLRIGTLTGCPLCRESHPMCRFSEPYGNFDMVTCVILQSLIQFYPENGIQNNLCTTVNICGHGTKITSVILR